MALKLDMSKMYDMVNWSFFLVVLRSMRFDFKWIFLIFKCISLVSYSILVNENVYGLFKLNCGWRQRFFVSLLVSFLCWRSNCNLRKEDIRQSSPWPRASRYDLEISHLLFSNDSLFFFPRPQWKSVI